MAKDGNYRVQQPVKASALLRKLKEGFIMGKVINFGFAPTHDPNFGIQRKNIAPRLTRNNWRNKAICRTIDGHCLYVMIQRAKIHENRQTQSRYFVQVHLGGPVGREFDADFQKLKDALAYANGEDGAVFAKSTQPATPEEYPLGHDADTYITGFSVQGRERRPNFTIRIPGRTH
ncbi:MAG: hypothetical protein HOI46_07215 [Rhodospirillaceae bacterium]|nr:hypothetical protein [Rhodospirillaceae bacterium]